MSTAPTKAVSTHYDGELTLDQFKEVLPPRMRRKALPDILPKINQLINDPTLRESFRENLMTYTSVIADGRYKIEGYIDAVKFVSCKLLGASDFKAWCVTFPDRYRHYTDIGSDQSHISSVVNAYKRGTLVNRILEQTLVPSHIINQDLYQEALNELAGLMRNANSEKVRSDSAAKLVDALKIPETTKIELDIGLKEDSSISDLRKSTLELVAMQRKMIESGQMTPKEIADTKLSVVDGESTVVENTE